MTEESTLLPIVIKILGIVEEHGPRLKALEINTADIAQAKKEQNGRIGRLEDAANSQKMEHARAAGRQDVRDSEKRVIQSILANVTHPMVYLVVGIAIGAGAVAASVAERVWPL